MISRSHTIFRKVTIVGIGLIGGSLAMAIRQHKIAREVIGVSRRQVTLNYATKNNIVDRSTSDIKKAVQGADLVVLALPVRSIIHVLSIIPGYLKRGCIVTDVGSIKRSIQDKANEKIPSSAYFVGGHPLAGSEKNGIVNANADLFNQSACILTKDEKTNKQALEKVRKMWECVGSRTKIMSPEEHDQVLAYISHLPHFIAYALVASIPPEMMALCSSGFKDTTRIAGSDPKLWGDVALENRKNVVKSIDEFVAILSDFRKSIVGKEEHSLIQRFIAAKEKRDQSCQ